MALNDLLDWNSLESSLIVPGQELFVPGARFSEHELNRVFGRLFIFPARGRLSSRFGVRGDPSPGSAASTTASTWPAPWARRSWRPCPGG